MSPRISGHFSIFGLVSFVLKSLLGIAGNCETMASCKICNFDPKVMLELSIVISIAIYWNPGVRNEIYCIWNYGM